MYRAWEPWQSMEPKVWNMTCVFIGGPGTGVPIVGIRMQEGVGVCVYTDTSLVLMFTDPSLCVHFGGSLWLCMCQLSTSVQVCVPHLASVVGV